MTEQGPSQGTTSGTPAGGGPADGFDPAKGRGALGRYRVMAYVTGVMLLILCLEVVLKYGFQITALDWVPRLHGFVYIVYLVTVWDLWSRMRWSWGRFVTMALAGVVPVMSFVLEGRVHRDATARIAG